MRRESTQKHCVWVATNDFGAPLASLLTSQQLTAKLADPVFDWILHMTDSLIGNLLVASSLVQDPVMGQAVCLLVHQDENQSIGVMLNRPIQPNPQALLKMLGSQKLPPQNSVSSQSPGGEAQSTGGETSSSRLDEQYFGPAMDDQSSELISAADADAEATLVNATANLGTVHFGGPLNGPVVAVHGSSEFAEAETGLGIYVAAQKPNLEGLVRGQDAPYRLIVGHIAWDNAQLQSEVDAGVWHTVPATTDAVFSNDQEMWPRLIRRATAKSVANWIGTPDVPMAAEVN